MVYFDDMCAPFGSMRMCHMLADSEEELLAMADRIGVQRRWHQYPGTHRSHFDIAQSKCRLAEAAGAVPITWRQTGQVARHRRLVLQGRAESLSILQILANAGSPARAPAAGPPPDLFATQGAIA